MNSSLFKKRHLNRPFENKEGILFSLFKLLNLQCKAKIMNRFKWSVQLEYLFGHNRVFINKVKGVNLSN